MVEAILAEVNWSATLLAEYQSLGRVLPALLFIQKHLAEPFTRDDLARELRLSAAQFHVVFKQALGVAPMEYVTRLRLRLAQELLLQTAESVTAVAARSGFQDPFHFSRQFRARCGVSPSGYRRVRLEVGS